MHASTLLIVIVVAIAVLIVIGLIAAAVGRRAGMRSLPDESKRRYAESWRAIEMKFVDDPRGAVREADDLAVSILRERGAHMHEGHMPRELQRAREASQTDERDERGGTEGLRRAMLEYRRIVEDAVGKEPEKARDHRREVA